MSKRSILVVDDDRSVRSYLSDFLTSCGYSIECAESGDQAVARLSVGYIPSLIVLDIVMPGINGIEVLESVKKINPSIPVIILSAAGQTKTVVEAMKMGAADFLVKPFEEQELELAIQNVLEKQKLKEEVKTLKRQLDSYVDAGDILSTNPKVLRIKEIAKQVADTDVPVLISGESGVGKEVLARFIHANSSRHDKPFVKVNCAALPDDLLESELFGYERGAFTGALNEKPGKFELADKGTILLDEIGEMTSHLQAKLLHVLQDSEYTRLGGKRTVRVDARVLASTNVNLEEDSMSLKDVGTRAAEQAEKELVLRVLEETSWNRKKAARRLNICYKALLNKLKRWQIDNRHSIGSAGRSPAGRDFQSIPF